MQQNKLLVLARKIRAMQSEKPIVSIVIPAFNEEKYLIETLRSVSEIDTVVPFEIIGVNNASTDRTRKIFSTLGVRVIDEERKGLSKARVAGILATRGEIIIQLDADSQVPKTFVDAHYDHYRNPEVVGVSAKCFIVNVHPLIYLWCVGSKLFRALIGQHREILYGIGPNISYRKKDITVLIDSYLSVTAQGESREDQDMMELIMFHGILIKTQGPHIDINLSGRKYKKFRQAVKFIGSSILRKIIWRYEKWFPEKRILQDVR
jgi:glycosyltransferase involved in cell wall biosynthesis